MSTSGYHADAFTDYEPERHTPRCQNCGGDLWLTTDGDGHLVSECSNCRLYARVRVRRGVGVDTKWSRPQAVESHPRRFTGRGGVCLRCGLARTHHLVGAVCPDEP
jgi:hypothetical protein